MILSGSRYQPRRRAPRRRAPLVAVVVALAVVVAAMAGSLVLRDSSPAGADPSAREDSDQDAAPAPAPDVAPDVAPDAATGWGPTAGELTRAREMVADWSPERLAGQVIVGRYHGTDPEVAATMVRELHLAGLSLQSENVADADQVRATTDAVTAAVAEDGRQFPAVLGVDQEGGTVAHLGDAATEFPAYVEAGEALEADPVKGAEVVREAALATGLELRDLGFTWVFAPVADVTGAGWDPTIGTRAADDDPEVVAQAVGASVAGYNEAALVSTTKHFPGHGAVPGDSHEVLPQLDLSLDELRERDLLPFAAAVEAGAPAVMMSHVDVQAVAPGVPATHAPGLYDLLAGDLGHEGLVVTDSLGMGAVMGQGRPALGALLAGADLLLMPADTVRTHATVTAAIESGEVPRERAEDAAATVVAAQLWQQRAAASVPVPDDVEVRAEAAADALLKAG